MGFSALPSQIVNNQKEVRRDLNAIESDYDRNVSMGNTLNMNRYYLVLIGKGLELYGSVRLSTNPHSLAYFEQQLEYLEYVFDTMSAKITDTEYNEIDQQFTEIGEVKGKMIIPGYEGEAKFMRVNEATDLKSKIRKLYRGILVVLDIHNMLTFKDLEPEKVLAAYGE